MLRSIFVTNARVCATVAALSGATLRAQTTVDCQSTWYPTFGGLPGFDGSTTLMAMLDDGNGPALYASGGFAFVAGVSASDVAKWDGATWAALGAGLNGPAYAATEFDDGSGSKLYFGGAFAASGSTALSYIASWDGIAWASVSTGCNNIVYDLEVFDDGLGSGPQLYACGAFTSAGGVSVNGVAKWNGASWTTLGAQLNFPATNPARAMTVHDDGSGTGPVLYVAGDFTSVAGIPMSRVARWNGTSWSPVGTGLDETVNDLQVYDDGAGAGPLLYACGEFDSVGGVTAHKIAKWDGATWSKLGSGLNGNARDMQVYDAGSGPALFVAGNFSTAGVSTPADHVAKWSSVGWEGLPTTVNDVAACLGVFDDGNSSRLIAGGWFTRAGGVNALRGAAWDGASWSSLGGEGLPQAVSAMKVYDDGTGDALFVTGSFAAIGTGSFKRIAKWDGTQWSPLGTGIPSGLVNALEVFDDGSGHGDELYVAGTFQNAGGVPVARIAKWDGAQWSALNGGGLDGSVSVLATFDDGAAPALYASGTFFNAGGSPANRIARWDGTSWSPLGAGVDSAVMCMCPFDDGSGRALYVGGTFSMAGGAPAESIARWDGTSWSPVGAGLDGGVSALIVFDDGSGPALHAGGSFVAPGGATTWFVAKWDGSTWSQVGTGLTGYVSRLAVFDSGAGPRLFVADPSTNHAGLVRLDGTQWNPVAEVLPPWQEMASIAAITEYDDGSGPALFVGGWFASAGTTGDSHIGKWRCIYTASEASYCTAGTTSNGCVPSMTSTGEPSAHAGSGFQISAMFVEGAKPGLMFYGLSGPNQIPWAPTSTSYLCVKPPVQRMGSLFSGGTSGACDGVLTQDWNAYIATHPFALGQPIGAGQIVWAQAWFRDPPAPRTTNLSDGLQFSLVP